MLNGIQPGQNPFALLGKFERNQKLSKTARWLVIGSLALGALSAIGVFGFTIAAAVHGTPALLIGSLICGIAFAIIMGRSIAHCYPNKNMGRERIMDAPSPFTESLYVDQYAIHPNQDRGIINWENAGFSDEGI